MLQQYSLSDHGGCDDGDDDDVYDDHESVSDDTQDVVVDGDDDHDWLSFLHDQSLGSRQSLCVLHMDKPVSRLALEA